MKRLILTTATVMALTMAGALVAQSPQNTTAPGPTQQLEPGQTNNNLPNPGNPVQVGPQPQTPPLQEQGTVSGTATESITGNQGANTTGPVTGTTGTTTLDQTETDVDVDTDTTATMDDQTETTTGTYTDTADDTDTLPATAGELPTVALIGLLALAAAFLVRVKRHA